MDENKNVTRPTFVLAVCSIAATLAAQVPRSQSPGSTPAAAPPRTGAQRVFVLKYADPVQTAALLRAFGASAVVDFEAHAIAVVSSFPDVMASIDDAIQRIDIPAAAQNIELTAHYIIGGATDSPLGSVLPKDLDSVAGELKTSSSFTNFRLLDALTVRLRAGQGADTTGTAGPVVAGSPMITTDFRIRSATVSTDSASVRIDHLVTTIKMPVPGAANQFTTSDLGFSADVDLKPGQNTVVGRIGMNRNQSLFLVLTARIPK